MCDMSAMFLNMSRVLVQFTVKFLRDSMRNKVLTIPPDYFVEKKEDDSPGSEGWGSSCAKEEIGSHMMGYDIDATLIAAVPEEEKATGKHGILSNLYFMAHCAIDLSFNQLMCFIASFSDQMC